MITSPMPFADAIGFLLDKEQLPADWNAAEWAAQEPDFRTKAFWVSKVESARFVDRSHGLLFDYMAKVRDNVTNPSTGESGTALRVAGREHFVKLMRDFMIAEGMAKPGEFNGVNQKDITDIRSVARLRLIFDTNVRQAYGFGQWKQGMAPLVRKHFPAARLIRDRGVKEPRPRHQAHLGDVRLKTDFAWWSDYINDPAIGGFQVPWGPYGFNSGVTQEDVSREDAAKRGIFPPVTPDPAPPASLTDGTTASTRGMDLELKNRLLDELRSGPEPRDIREVARNAAAKVRGEMLTKGLQAAEQRGDDAKAAKYRKAFAALPNRGLSVVDNGESISLLGSRESIRKYLEDGTLEHAAALQQLLDSGMTEADALAYLASIQ